MIENFRGVSETWKVEVLFPRLFYVEFRGTPLK